MKIIYKDAKTGISELENNSIQSCITSPPYYQVRNYKDNPLQIGLENTPQKYIDNLIFIFEVLKNKLSEDGSLFVNIGDKYDKDKNLMLIPSMFAINMKENGWILRNDIVWYKPNFQPSPVKDRLCNTYEHIFHFVLNKSYYYDLDSIRVENKCETGTEVKTYERFKTKISNSNLTDTQKKNALLELDVLFKQNKINKDARLKIRGESKSLFGSDIRLSGRAKELQEKGYCFHCNNPLGKNMGDLLSVNIKSHKGEHEAVFPDELIEPLIKCSSKENDIILDCFAGSGTTLRVAENLNRIGLGFDINEYT
jgi:DNA modification methylase